MKINKLNKLLTILVPAIAMAASQPASAMSPHCATLASSMLNRALLTEVAVSTGGATSFLGIGLGVVEYVYSRRPRTGGYLGFLADGLPGAATMVGIAGSASATSSVGSISAIVHAISSNEEPVSSNDQRDFMRQYRETQDYRCVRAELGRARTEEFFANAFSGWSVQELAREYLSAPAYEQFIAISTSVPSANCSEENMSCGG